MFHLFLSVLDKIAVFLCGKAKMLPEFTRLFCGFFPKFLFVLNCFEIA